MERVERSGLVYLEELPSGRWRAIVQHQRRRRSVSARTRGEAQLAAARLLLELGATPKASGLTIGALLAGHLAEREKVWSPSTFEDRTAVATKLPTRFADLPVEAVNVPMVIALWRDLGTRETPHRVHRLGQMLGTAYQDAIRSGLIPGPNPFHDSPPPRPEKGEISVPTDAQVRALLESDQLMGLFLRLGAVSGMRRGELCAVQWSALDLERATLAVMRSLVQVAGQPLYERRTKTGPKGQRVVTLDPGTIAALTSWKAAQDATAASVHLPVPVWVFSDDHGMSPWRPKAISNRMAHYRDRHNAGSVTIKDLRHYVATTMLEDGVSPIDVANQLGHASTSTTLNVYAHFVPGRNRAAVDRLAARLDGAE